MKLMCKIKQCKKSISDLHLVNRNNQIHGQHFKGWYSIKLLDMHSTREVILFNESKKNRFSDIMSSDSVKDE